MDKVKFNIGGVVIEMDKEEASKAFEAGTVEIKSDDLVTYSKESFETFKTNLANEEYKKGKTAGEEMPFKYETLKDKFGIEVKGKSLDNFAEAYKEKIIEEANIKPTEKITGLENDLKTIQTNYDSIKGDFEQYKQNIEAEKTQAKKDTTLLSFMPDNLLVDKDIALMALKTKKGIDVTFNESGKALQSINGELQKDDRLEPKEFNQDFVVNNLKELGLLKEKQGGSGGGDNTGGGAKGSYEDFEKRMQANDIAPGSQEFNEKMQTEISAGTLKM